MSFATPFGLATIVGDADVTGNVPLFPGLVDPEMVIHIPGSAPETPFIWSHGLLIGVPLVVGTHTPA